jgi:DNA-binding CsgD family transcriptional regulator
MPFGAGNPVTIGRDDLLRLIDGVLEDACNRVSRALLLTGEAGIGKTHLLRELSHRCKPLDLRVVTVRCSPGDEYDHFGLFVRLGVMLGEAQDTPPSDAERFATARRLVDSLRSVPTVLVIDDLQWSDYFSQRTLLHLFDALLSAGIAVVAVSRPTDEMQNEAGAANLRAIGRLMESHEVNALSMEDSAALVSASLGREVETRTIQSLMSLTNGNPFFLLELVNEDTGISAESTTILPREVEAILDARLDLLGNREDAVALVAIAGDVGTVSELEAAFEAAGIREEDWQEALNAASRLRILSVKSGNYEFRHRLFTQRLDDRLSHSRRNALHAAVAMMLAGGMKHVQAVPHVARSGRSIETGTAAAIVRLAHDENVATGNHTGTIDSAEWLLANALTGTGSVATVMVELARALIAVGRREEGYSRAEEAVLAARSAGDHETEAEALMQWTVRRDFAEHRSGTIEAFRSLDLTALAADTRVRVLATWAQVAVLSPTTESVPDRASSVLLSALEANGGATAPHRTAGPSAWNWSTHAEEARHLAERAAAEAQGADVSDEARTQALLAWRETHRSPDFLVARSERTETAVRLARPGTHVADAARFCRILDLLESGDLARAEAAIASLRSDADESGSFIARWWAEFLTAGRHLSRGELDLAAQSAQRAYDHGAQADEPGRTMIMLEQMAVTMVERGIPAEMHGVFATSTGVVANDYARAVAALANASFGNAPLVRAFLDQSRGVLSDPDREAAWLPAVTAIVEAAHLIGDETTAAECLPLLEPFETHQATFIGSTVRGSVRRYVALARAAAGDRSRAIDDLLVARNDERLAGQHLWALACSVDIAELLAGPDPERALHLVDPAEFAETAPLGHTWRAGRGRAAVMSARRVLMRRLGLTDRQSLIIMGLLGGATIKAIAEDLGYSHSTIRQESMEIYRTLGIGGRADLPGRAQELRII